MASNPARVQQITDMVQGQGGAYSERLIKAALRNGAGVPPNQPGACQVFDTDFWHVQTFTSASTTSLSFFNTAQAIGTTNWPVPNQMPANQIFIIKRIHIQLSPVNAEADVAASAPITLLEQVSNVLEAGTLILSTAQREYLNIRDLRRFPAGRGLYVNPALSITAPAAAAIQTNGFPTMANGFDLSANPITIWPTQNFSLTLNWQATQTLTGNGNLDVRLWGTVIKD